MNAAMKYRPDIDGLRAIAVLLVLGFHAFPRSLPGGFVGVDIFFVISGYLISLILFEEKLAGTFSYVTFYSRRIRRIFPALLAVMSAVLVAGFFLDFSSQYATLGKHVTAGAAFISNIVLWLESGYFDTDAQLKPLLHLWSLGVEEQYYILWPLVLAALPRRVIPGALLGIGVVSFGLNLWGINSHGTAVFFLPATRFWELMVGSALAFWVHAHSSQPGTLSGNSFAPAGNTLSHAGALAGLALIVAAVAFIDEDTAFPGWAALLPTLGAALLIAAGPRALVNRALLSRRPVVFIGVISYPLYLWHWPILSFLHIEEGPNLSRTLRLLAVGASFALAWLTYVAIEKPIRFRRGHVPLKVGGLCAGMLCLAVVGYALPRHLLPESPRDAFVAAFDNSPPTFAYGSRHDLFTLGREECNFYDLRTKATRDAIAPGCFTAAGGTKVLLWGDSHIQHLGSGLRASLPTGLSLLQVATSGCKPRLEGSGPDGGNACIRSNQFALRTVQAHQPALVVLAQRSAHDATDWQALARTLKAHGAQAVLLLGPVPEWTQPLHLLAARHYWPEVPRRLQAHLAPEPFETDHRLAERYGRSSELRYLSLIEALCNREGCLTQVGPDLAEELITFDTGHLTPAASKVVVQQAIAPVMLELLHLETGAAH